MPDKRFDELFDQHALEVSRYIARRHVGDDVEDLTADVFTIAWQKLSEIPEGFELPWLYRTAWNVLANAHRKIEPIPVDYDLSEIDDDVADVVIENATVEAAWLQLPARDREILRLVAWDGLTGKQLAHALGISESGAGVALSRARNSLKKIWDELAVEK